MSNASAVSQANRAVRTSRQTSYRMAAFTVGVVGLLVSSTHKSAAQTSPTQAKSWEFRVTGGAFVPAGNQRNSLQDGQMTAAQVSWLLRPSVALTGTFGWARSRDVGSENSPKLDVFTSDVGMEARSATWFAGRKVSFSPFVGAGAGARSYNYRALDVDATNNLAAYASVGGEIGVGRVGVRLEARDYATGFKPLVSGGKSETRNDVVIMAALRFNRRAAQH